MDENYQVLHQWDSWGITEEQFIYYLTGQWDAIGDMTTPEILVVEDLPHKLPYSTLIKTVCRLQGRIVQSMHESIQGRTEDVLFLAPAEWRKTYSGMGRGTGPGVVVPVSAALGYTPPDLTDRITGVKGAKAIARKVSTDYCSAYLIARWAVATKKDFGTYDIVGTSRYDTQVIRKKDFDGENN